MLKTLKGKVIAGTVAFGLVAGGGVAFGATDAGQNLLNWYNAQFGKSSERITKEVAAYGNGKIDGFVEEYNGLKTVTTTKLTERGEAVAGATNKAVRTTADGHIDAIKEQKAHIESYLGDQFDKLAQFTQGLINETGDKALKDAHADLQKHANEVGAETRKNMEEDMNAATAAALKDLEETIKWAKEDLQAQLDKETGLTIEEIKAMIDKKIAELRQEITKKNNALIALEEKIIVNTGKMAQVRAQEEIERMVNNMNN